MRTTMLAGMVALVLALAGASSAVGASAPKTYGWRGNWTGLYPDADPPIQWGRIAKGVVAGTTCQAAKPPEGAPKSGQPLIDSFIRDWLIIGPFPLTDSVKDFGTEQIPGEAQLAPAEGDKVGELTWKRFEM